MEKKPNKSAPVITQSAIFNTLTNREYLINKDIYCTGETNIKFNGETFNQFDYDVFMALMHMSLEQKSYEVHFDYVDISDFLGKARDEVLNKKIRESIIRLTQASLQIKSKTYGVTMSGSFFDRYILKDLEPEKNLIKHLVKISDSVFDLFKITTNYKQEIRNELSTSLAKFYYIFFCSHGQEIYNYNLETYKELSGSQLLLTNFKQKSREAFEEIYNKTANEIEAKLVKSKTGKDQVKVKKTKKISND